ncbi:MAG: hypothetical protein ACO1QR_04970 [Chthoniobacteraceae bacterium]
MKTGLIGVGLVVAISAFAQDATEKSLIAPNVDIKVSANLGDPRAWGRVVDPDRDSTFKADATSLTIAVPGSEKPHDFAPELGVLNAPRVVSDVYGDFSTEVQVSGSFEPGGESTLESRVGYNGAGLILIGDEKNCVTLARATLQREGGEPQSYLNFELRKNGELTRIGSIQDRPIDPDKPVYLRLERKGSEVTASISEDGTTWDALPPKALGDDWPRKNQVGVVAISTSRKPFEPKFAALKSNIRTIKSDVAVEEHASAKSKPEGLDLDAVRKGLPETITPLTDEQLVNKVPHFYYFEYEFEPQPGKRYWIRVDKDTWKERYPDGQESTFKVLGHAKVEGTEGTMVVKISGDEEATSTTNDGGLQAFIPDKGSETMLHFYRNSSRGDAGWSNLGPMQGVH